MCIADDGPGIPVELQSLIFVPLNKGASTNPGTGLGVAICEKIVEDHHGKIWCTNAENGGAQFFIRLPNAPLAIQKATQSGASSDPTSPEPEERSAQHRI